MAGLRWSNTVTGQSSTFGLGSSLVFYPDIMQTPFAIGVGVVTSSSGSTYSVEHTFDYTGSSTFISTAATWFGNSGLTSLSSNGNGNYAFPVSAIRLNVTAGSSTVVVTMTALQAGV